MMKSGSSTTTGDVQDSSWTPHRHFPKAKTDQKKTMVTVWWSVAGVLHYNFLQPGQTITAESYSEEIDEMYRKLRQQQPVLVNRRGPILLHDNARPHVSQITVRKLNELSVEVLPHPPYSPEMSLTGYHLFKYFDNFLTGRIRQKRPSSTSSNPEPPIFMSTELIDLCFVGKSALIQIALISIKLNKYSLRYYSLK